MREQRKPKAKFTHLLNTLCPWHLVINDKGLICSHGPSLEKFDRDGALIGANVFDFLELRRPKTLNTIERLIAQSGRKLHFVTRETPHTELKGVVVPLPDDAFDGVKGGLVLNLSFGISVVEAVRDYSLTGADFAITDLTVEMLYLVEAKSAVTQELGRLNARLQGARAQAEQQALTDTLTGLGNRRAMDQAFEHLASKRSGVALMNIDLDYFKQVNDTFGHAAGDTVLEQVAKRLRRVTREEDTLIRHGGDEFAIILPGLTDLAVLSSLAERLVSEIEKPVLFGDQKLHVSASIGISLSKTTASLSSDQMMEEADVALYVVKEHGRHGYRIYSPDMEQSDHNKSVA